MLVLTAKRDDRIKIGDNIEVLIIYTADSRVRIGIEAPKELRIERKPKQKEVAAAASDSAIDTKAVAGEPPPAAGAPSASAPPPTAGDESPAAANGAAGTHGPAVPRLKRPADAPNG